MINNKKLMAAVIFPIAFLALWTGWLQYQRLTEYKRVTVSASGYDPRDLLSGHYVNLQLDWQKTDCAQFAENICPEQDFEKFYIYYLPEHEAPRLEKLMQKQGRSLQTDLVFVYRPGEAPLIEKLLVNGEEWQAGLRKFRAKNSQAKGEN